MSETNAEDEVPAKQPAPSRAKLRVPPQVGKSAKAAWVAAIYDERGRKLAEVKVDAGAELELGIEEV